MSMLLYTQVLRNLTMAILVSMNADNACSTISTYVYQPQLYLKLRKLFPDVDPYIIFWASHILHGATATSTYHIWYDFYFAPLPKVNGLGLVYSSINSSFGVSRTDRPPFSTNLREQRKELQKLYKEGKYKEAFVYLCGLHKIEI
jgi:hypothetical protein